MNEMKIDISKMQTRIQLPPSPAVLLVVLNTPSLYVRFYVLIHLLWLFFRLVIQSMVTSWLWI